MIFSWINKIQAIAWNKNDPNLAEKRLKTKPPSIKSYF